MPSFNISQQLLMGLFKINQLGLPSESEMVLVGLRGCYPDNTDNQSFVNNSQVNLTDIDYKNLRCTIIQWKPQTGEFALFPASTVPCITYISDTLGDPSRKKSNIMMPGYYKNYVKGKHHFANPAKAFNALVQVPNGADSGQPLIIRRPFKLNTGGFDFGPIQIDKTCCDNIHASYSNGSGVYSSAGCQVIQGIPKRPEASSIIDDTGPWKIFKNNAYSLNQNIFPFALFKGTEAYTVSKNLDTQMSVRLKFGAEGDLVKAVQTKLISLSYLRGAPTGLYEETTFIAIKNFQNEVFGSQGVDGIIGSDTASHLDIVLPVLNL